jgi:hypothetical protein
LLIVLSTSLSCECGVAGQIAGLERRGDYSLLGLGVLARLGYMLLTGIDNSEQDVVMKVLANSRKINNHRHIDAG